MFGWTDRENRNTSNQSGQTGCGIRFARALNMEQTGPSWAGRPRGRGLNLLYTVPHGMSCRDLPL